MEISLRKVIPSYIEEEKVKNSGIWNNDIVFRKGAYAHMVAASGQGKTSLIHFIYGLRKDYTGSISYDLEAIHDFDAEGFSPYRQKNISIVFQDLRLFAAQTARENIEIKRQLAPYHEARKIAEMAARLGVATKLDKVIKTCSYGEQQRIAIIRALMQPFDFLLLDEPFSNLDEINRAKAMELIDEECKARGAGMIFADLKLFDFFKGHKVLTM